MAFIIEYTFTRPSTDVAWTYEFEEDQQAQIQEARELHEIVTEESTSADSLVYKIRQTVPDSKAYAGYYKTAQSIWEAAGIVYKSKRSGIKLSLDVIESEYTA